MQVNKVAHPRAYPSMNFAPVKVLVATVLVLCLTACGPKKAPVPPGHVEILVTCGPRKTLLPMTSPEPFGAFIKRTGFYIPAYKEVTIQRPGKRYGFRSSIGLEHFVIQPEDFIIVICK
jgi:hypothetical protein